MVYGSVEAPKGELGYFIVTTEKATTPYRCHVRPPSFINLQMLPAMVEGHLVADLVAVIGTLDIVLGRDRQMSKFGIRNSEFGISCAVQFR